MRLLMVAYDFPPVGGVGVQRALKFARYLPEHDVEPIVLSNAHALGRARDDSLIGANDLTGLTILRAGGDLLGRYHGWRDLHRSSFPYTLAPLLAWSTLRWSDLFGLWYASLRSRLTDLARTAQIDAVWTTVPHPSVAWFGLHLSRDLGLPWIVDVRDAIVGAVDRQSSGVLARLQEKFLWRLEGRVSSKSDCIVAVSQPIIDNMLSRHSSLRRDRCLLLPNGFDADDLRPNAQPAENKRLTFIYAGTFTGRRTPRVLVEGIARAVSHNLLPPDEIQFEFYGRYEREDQALLGTLPVPHRLHGFVSQAQAIEATRAADVALIVTVPGNDPAAQEVLTGKVYECLGLRKRVLALTDASPLKDLIASARLGDSCSAGDPDAVADALSRLYQIWRRNGHVRVEPDPTVISRYERRAQAGVLASRLHQIVRTR